MPLPSNFRSAPGLWIHRDTSITNAIEEGLGRSLRRDWASGSLGDRVRAWQGLLVERAMLMASLGGTLEPAPAEGFAALINPSPLPSTAGERRAVMVALYRTCEIFATDEEAQRHIETSSSSGDTGIVITWPIAAVAVAVVIAGAAAIGYAAHQSAQIIDRSLSRSEDAQRLAQRDAELLKLIRDHQEQEQKAGKQLPLSEPQRLALDALLDQQRAIVSKQEAPLHSGVSGGSLFDLSTLAFVGLGVGLGFAVSKL